MAREQVLEEALRDAIVNGHHVRGCGFNRPSIAKCDCWLSRARAALYSPSQVPHAGWCACPNCSGYIGAPKKGS